MKSKKKSEENGQTRPKDAIFPTKSELLPKSKKQHFEKIGTDLKSGVKKIGSSLGELVAPIAEFLGAAWPVVAVLAVLAGGIAVWKKT